MKKSKIIVGIFDGQTKNIRYELVDNDLVLSVDTDEYEGYAMVDRLRYHDYEPDFDLIQFDNMMYLNEEDIY